MNKKILASLILIGLLGAAAGIGTWTYFSSTRTIDPGFYTASLNLELTAREDWRTVLGNMAPGDDRAQIFDLKNTGSTGGKYSELEISYEAPCLCVSDGTKDWAEVSIPVDIALKDITQLSFWKKVASYGASGWNPNIILAIDADNDGDFDGDLPGYHFGTGIKSDAFVEGEFPVGLTATDTDFTRVNALTDMAWWGADTSGNVGPTYYVGNLGLFQTTSYGKIDPTDHVKFIKIVIGGAGSWMNERAYVRDIGLNGVLQTLPDIGEVITVTVEEWHSGWVTVNPVGSTLKQWAGYKMKILDDSGGVGAVQITLHFKESAGNEYQSICGDIDFTFTLWQGP